MKRKARITSRQQVCIGSDPPNSRVINADGNIFATLEYLTDMADQSLCLSGRPDDMQQLAVSLHRFADDIDIACERVIGEERDEMDREMRQAEEDERDQVNIAKAQGY